jgi:hypothetical protein
MARSGSTWTNGIRKQSDCHQKIFRTNREVIRVQPKAGPRSRLGTGHVRLHRTPLYVHYLTNYVGWPWWVLFGEKSEWLIREVVIHVITVNCFIFTTRITHKGCQLMDFKSAKGYLFLACLVYKEMTKKTWADLILLVEKKLKLLFVKQYVFSKWLNFMQVLRNVISYHDIYRAWIPV